MKKDRETNLNENKRIKERHKKEIKKKLQKMKRWNRKTLRRRADFFTICIFSDNRRQKMQKTNQYA